MTLAPPVVQARYARWEGIGRGFRVLDATVGAEPGPGEVLVRVDLATICGSDLHTVAGNRPAPAPGVLGHEQVGTVVGVGPGAPAHVDGSPVTPGTRVVWSVAASCGDCPRCRRDRPQKCRALFKYGHEAHDPGAPLSGGFATHCLLRPGTAIVRVPDAVPDAVAAPAACATATVAAALAAAPGLRAGDRVLVTGAGMLGLAAAAMAAEAGAEVVVSDPHPRRRERARAFGAHATVDPHGAATGEIGEVDLAVEVSGAASAVRTCLDTLAVGATAVLVGPVSPGPAVDLDPERLVRGWHTVTGVHNYHPRDLARAVDFLAGASARHPFAQLVSDPYDLDDVARAVRAATTGSTPRTAVRPGT